MAVIGESGMPLLRLTPPLHYSLLLMASESAYRQRVNNGINGGIINKHQQWQIAWHQQQWFASNIRHHDE